MATTAIKRVKSIHDHLHGVLPDGRPYHVSDPHLLYWVHLTETFSFLNSYELFMRRALSRTEKDQYVREMGVIAKELGCEDGFRVVMNCNEKGGQTVYHIHMHVLGQRQMNWPPG